MLGDSSLPSEFQIGDSINLIDLKVTSVRFTEEGVFYDLRLDISTGEEKLDEEDFYFLADIPESVLLHNK